MVTAIYNGKSVPMDYIDPPKDRFRFACMRIIDNGADGYVVDERGRVYSVTQGSRKAKLLPAAEAATVLECLTR